MRMSTKRKYKEVPNRNHKAEKYNNYTEKFNRGVQQKTNLSGRMDRQPRKEDSRIYPIKGVKRKKKKRVNEYSLRDLRDNNKPTNIT